MSDIQTQLPTDDQAVDFAAMIQSGLPAVQAILYFIHADTPDEVEAWARRWQGSRAVNAAITKLMKRPWQEMSDDEREEYSLKLHYNQLRATLMSLNYLTASLADKNRMDDARRAIEARRAGTAGMQGGLEMFYADLRAGKIKLNPQRAALKPERIQ